jgi:polyisoprenoid-binding protein YceI
VEEKMKNKVPQLAFAAMLVAGFASPALAQTTNWKLNSDHSTSRLFLSSTADPDTTVDVGIARVEGSVTLDANSIAHSSFDFTIYPGDQAPATINADGSVNAADFPNVPRASVITFRSRSVKPRRDGKLVVAGDLTLSYLDHPATITNNDGYSGPVYGEPMVHVTTRKASFVFDRTVAATTKTRSARSLKLVGDSDIKTEDFPQLFDAITNANWPVVVENKACDFPATVGEDYQGASCTGNAVVTASHPPESLTVGDDYPGPAPVVPGVRDTVGIALNLELTRDTSGRTASGN